jgi:hypothetical protein
VGKINILIFAVALVIVVFFVVYLFCLHKDTLKKIDMSIVPHFVDIKLSTTQILELISALWLLKKFVTKLIKENSLEDKARPINSNFKKIDNILKAWGYDVIDYTGQKYNEGMNVDIINNVKVENDCPVIQETIEPSIVYKGNLLKRAKIIREIKEGKNE